MAFSWSVHAGGYVFQTKAEGRVISERPGAWPGRAYQPLAEQGLFRAFGQTCGTEEGILAFATRYGLLGFKGEVLNGWKREIERMRSGIALWDTWCHQPTPDIAAELTQTLNTHLGRTARSQSALAKRPKLAGAGVAAVSYDPVTEKFRLELQPANLLNAMWIQLATAVMENKVLRQCATCGGWFELSPELRRADARYCREACRTKAYRDRKEKAKRLFFTGMPVVEIANQLNTKPKLIKSWIRTREDKVEE